MDSEMVYAIVLGTLFGFALYKVGAADPDRLMAMLRLRDLDLAKSILGAIGISTILLYTGVLLEIVPMEHFSIKGIYWGVIVGGVIFGLGWAISGFCPGTGMAGLGVGRLDALVYFIGGLVGVYIFAVSYAGLTDTFLYTTLFGGTTTIVETKESIALFTGYWSPIIAIIIGACFIFIALKLPKRLK